ncbi:helix-turn-helix transcriptional regulator [Ponticaulis sp.]|uniref:helix-turn-helix domain-containing protein n=1 Tax=Ponticaulis sp. TaxID=2020902 RepID=UPI000B6CEABF|nr:helix-turn-helix transcriptional regulator [Ponticaulis sp.]MAI91767.1 transcriptional regulator [Ponticaulis sp.]OUX97025.1 MAG: transcriptional regulator [Hyphomonadaceae bacterium TMED5]|tara:strand:- start:41102 stop:41323 length:222 start_codon:yes stop_codon:yes gene_type:complete
MEIQKLIGQNVRAFREERGWSQEQLAFEAGLHRTYVSGIERGVRNPTATVIEQLAITLKVKPSALFANWQSPE